MELVKGSTKLTSFLIGAVTPVGSAAVPSATVGCLQHRLLCLELLLLHPQVYLLLSLPHVLHIPGPVLGVASGAILASVPQVYLSLLTVPRTRTV